MWYTKKMNVNSSISFLSHIHTLTADFLTEKLKQQGFKDFASSHGNIMYQLNLNNKMTMSELSKKINRNKSTTTVLVRKLEREGFVVIHNDDNDKRNKFILLSKKGKEYNNATTQISQQLLSTFYNGFTEQEKITFINYLERIEKNFNSTNTP